MTEFGLIMKRADDCGVQVRLDAKVEKEESKTKDDDSQASKVSNGHIALTSHQHTTRKSRKNDGIPRFIPRSMPLPVAELQPACLPLVRYHVVCASKVRSSKQVPNPTSLRDRTEKEVFPVDRATRPKPKTPSAMQYMTKTMLIATSSSHKQQQQKNARRQNARVP
jgi:hypothetical protein